MITSGVNRPIQIVNAGAAHDLLVRVARGDKAAFAALYTMYRPKLRSCAMRIVRLEEWSDDVLQESFVTIWREAGRFDIARSSPMTWMSTIVKHKAIDVLRHHMAREQFHWGRVDDLHDTIHDVPDPGLDPSELAELGRLRQRIGFSLEKLGAPQRRAIELCFFHELSHFEVALEMALPLGTVKTCIRRGCLKLHKDLKAHA